MKRMSDVRSAVRGFCATALLGAVSAAAAADTAEQALRDELRDAVERVIASGAFGDRKAGDIAVSFSLPAERRVDLGLLLDRRASATGGLAVLGTTPGGQAQSLGLRAGDVIVAVGSTSLEGLGTEADGSARAVGVLRQSVDGLPDGGRLQLAILRDGRRQTVEGQVTPRYLPPLRVELGESDLTVVLAPSTAGQTSAASQTVAAATAAGGGCGRISTFHVAPRQQRLFAAHVLQIDGRTPGARDQETFRVAPGRYQVLVSEAIDPVELPMTMQRRRATLGRRTLEVTVEAGQTVMIAARLLDARGGRDYWEPVVWKSIAEECR